MLRACSACYVLCFSGRDSIFMVIVGMGLNHIDSITKVTLKALVLCEPKIFKTANKTPSFISEYLHVAVATQFLYLSFIICTVPESHYILRVLIQLTRQGKCFLN